jgi:DEAD/DEAH box helicase domain-containing protein
MTGRVWEAEAPRAPVGSGRGQRLLERVLAGHEAAGPGEPEGPLRHAVHLPARPGRPVDWPDWVPPTVRTAFVGRGVQQPWSHQARAA